MRVMPSILVIFLVAAPAAARPFHVGRAGNDTPRPVLHMPDVSDGRMRWSRRDQDAPLIGHRAEADPASGGLSFGPVHADSEVINGRRRMHYRVDGLSMAGGDVSGSVSTHAAEVYLRWPAQN